MYNFVCIQFYNLSNLHLLRCKESQSAFYQGGKHDSPENDKVASSPSPLAPTHSGDGVAAIFLHT